jgi:putative solute:sodium symporter small subunit
MANELKEEAPTNSENAYWQRTRHITFSLLAIWFLMNFLVLFFARELASVSVFGWPLSFLMAAQGLSFVYLLLIGIFCAYMRKLERR